MLKSVMSVGVVFAIFSIVLVDAIRSEQYIGNAINEDFPGMCYYNGTHTAIPLQTTYRPNTECVEIYCREDYVLHLLFCGPYQIGDGCTLSRKEGAPYPDCCPDIDCPTSP